MLSPEAFHSRSEFVFPFANMIRKTDRTILLSDSTTNGLAHPPVRVSYKLKPTARLKFFERSHQAYIAFLNEVKKWYPPASITVCHMNNEAEVGTDHAGFDLGETLVRTLPGTMCGVQG
jgi:hypothetical protein